MSELLHFAGHGLQEAALLVMACVYSVRLVWLLRFHAARERQAPSAPWRTGPAKGVAYSWLIIGMPWAMESSRRRPQQYAQFVIFHLGVAAAIALSFIIPYAPELLALPGMVVGMQLVIGAAWAVGLLRLYRRISDRIMRAISSPDDYFSLALLTVWFFFAFFAAPNRYEQGETVLLVYFFLTAFFLLYVPFSKISHYLYYPFTRYYLGKTMGHRGVFPLLRGPRPGRAEERILVPSPGLEALAAGNPDGKGGRR